MRWQAVPAFAAALILAACGASETARHTVDEYRADEPLRRAQLDRCANDPGTLQHTPDCVNAKQAARLERKSLRDLPPVQLPKTE